MPILSRSDLLIICQIVEICLTDDADRVTLMGNLHLTDADIQRISLLADTIVGLDANSEYPLAIPFVLKDWESGVPNKREIAGEVNFWPNDFDVTFHGYSMANDEGDGPIVVAELHNDTLQLLVWSDINTEDPIVISMEGAKEEKRTDE